MRMQATMTATLMLVVLGQAAQGQGLHPKVLEAEKKRIAVINKVKPSVVAVMARDPRGNLTGNGSGVLIDEEGYCLTNWHVTSAARSPLLKCGLPDGVIYDAVLVGLDKVGDVALIKLLPRKPGDKFPFAKMGDSETVKAGDWSLAMGNPFSLATDFTPTVTFGLVSGVHRYQYPAGTLLEYTDCIQIDTSINPGNSGGPLFNMDAELIGINGRGSFEKRGRVNSGVGYAISINQIKNFLGHMRVGLDTDHASLGASMESEAEDGGISRILVKSIIDSDARRRGLDVGDQLVSFAGRPMTTVNQYKNVLGLFPRGWRMPLVFRRDNLRSEVLVRLMGVQSAPIEERPGAPSRPVPGTPPGRPAPLMPAGPTPPSAKLFKAKDGFANYYFNEEAQKRLLGDFTRNGDFTKLTGDWTLKFSGKLFTGANAGKTVTSMFLIKERGATDGKSPKVLGDVDGLDFPLEPLNVNEKPEAFRDPPESGGLVLAVFLYRQFLAYGAKGFTRDFHHGGVEPYYPPTKDEKPNYAAIRVLAEVLRGKYAQTDTRWYFAIEDDREGRWKKGQLIGFEVTPDKDEDPCEVCLAGYRDFNGKQMPSIFHVRRGGKPYAELTLTSVTLK
ncbi:MAG: trypsin-like peptidase domain-containing protein [Gemmataceae bacterium]